MGSSTALNEGPFQGWDLYPMSLPNSQDLSFAYDLEKYREQLWDNAKSLFIPQNKETTVKVIEFGRPPRVIIGLRDLERYLLESADFRGTRSILIPQPSSLDNLIISETGFKKLLTFFGAFPAVLDIARAFGETLGEDERSAGNFRDHLDFQRDIYESTFLLKHVERHEREEQSDPWSIRQTGVYFQANKHLGQNTFVLINASKRVQQRMKAASVAAVGAREMHLLLLSTVMHGWRQYLDYLEHRLDIVNKKIKQKVNYDVEFADMLEVHNIRHNLCMARGGLLKDSDASSAIAASTNDHISTTDTVEAASATSFVRMACQFERELCSEVTRTDNILRRLDGASDLIRATLDLHAASATQLSARKTQQMTELAKDDNDLMVEMTKKSQADARTLKSITILTLFYLPASFVSTLLSMGYITIQKSRLHFTPEMIIFGVLTLSLLTITFGLWGVSEWRQRRWSRNAFQPMRSKHLSP